MGKSGELGLEYWKRTAKRSQGEGMSRVVKGTIQEYGEMFKDSLFTGEAPRMLIAVSYVNNSGILEGVRGWNECDGEE